MNEVRKKPTSSEKFLASVVERFHINLKKTSNFVKISLPNMEKESKIHAYDKTQRFLKAAIADGAHLSNPGQNDVAWVKRKNVVAVYFGTDVTLEELGNKYDISRERTRQLVLKGVKLLWRNCSPKTRQRFPLLTIPLSKPPSLKTKVKNSQALGGRTYKLYQNFIQNAENQSENGLRDKGKLAAEDLKRLESWGLEIPSYLKAMDAKTLERNIKKKKGKELQKELDIVSYHFYRNHKNGEKPLLTPLLSIVRPLNLSTRQYNKHRQNLQNENIAVGKIEITKNLKEIRYHFIATKDKAKSRRILKRLAA